MSKLFSETLGSFCLFLALGTVALAEDVKPQPQPDVSNTPAQTTASYGDWTLRCQRVVLNGTTPQKLCEVTMLVQVKGEANPVAQIAFGRLEKQNPLQITAVLPNNISLPSTVRIQTKGKKFDIAWTRCTPVGCFATGDVADDQLQSLRKAEEPAKLTFRDAAAREFTLPVSLNGLAQAMDALAKE